jgi:hypothetical protein
MPTFSPEQYAKRDRLLLLLAALFRILIPRCIAQLVAAGKPLTHALNRLTDDGDLVRLERFLPGGLTGYMLSPQGCGRIGAPRDRAELPSGAALDAAIAVQFFSTLGPYPRFRTAADEASELLGTAVPANVPWICSRELGETKMFRAVLTLNRLPAEAVRHLRTLADQALQHAKLGPWISAHQLGFAVLAPTASSAAAIEKAVEQSGLRQRVAIVVGLGPDAEHLAAALKQYDGRK